MDNLLRMAEKVDDDWYEVMRASQPGDVRLESKDRARFNDAFTALTSHNYVDAFEGFRELSEKGSFISQYFLGVMYLNGTGVLQDFMRAHMWLNIASSRGHKKAHIELEKLTKQLNIDLVAGAQNLARECVANNYQDR